MEMAGDARLAPTLAAYVSGRVSVSRPENVPVSAGDELNIQPLYIKLSL